MKTLTPQLKAQELILNTNFQLAIQNQQLPKIKELVSETIKESYLEFAFQVIHLLENHIKHNETIDTKTINQLRDSLQSTRLFKPL